MLDNLRGDSNSPFFQDDEPASLADRAKAAMPSMNMPGGKFLGMTALQRFVLAAMLFMVVCVIGGMFLLVTGSFYLPFF